MALRAGAEQPLGILEDVLVQVNKLVFPADFYVLDVEDNAFGKGSTLILGRPFFMTVRTKIDVHAGTLSMEFVDNLVQFNIFEAMKHPTKDHLLFSIDIMDGLVEEYMQIGTDSADFYNFVEIPNVIDCFNFVEDLSNSVNMFNLYDLPDFEDNIVDLADMVNIFEFSELIGLVCRCGGDSENKKGVESDSRDKKATETDSNIKEEVETDSTNLEEVETDSRSSPEDRFESCKLESMQGEAKSNFGQLSLHSNRDDQPIPISTNKFSPPHSPPIELKPLLDHLKYAYLDDHQHFPVIIANNFNQEQEEKLLSILRKHKKAIGWTDKSYFIHLTGT
ncbi:hypothetical protein CR513_56170, partial [Mucuna pruriens]